MVIGLFGFSVTAWFGVFLSSTVSMLWKFSALLEKVYNIYFIFVVISQFLIPLMSLYLSWVLLVILSFLEIFVLYYFLPFKICCSFSKLFVLLLKILNLFLQITLAQFHILLFIFGTTVRLVGSLFPDQGLNLGSWQWEYGILTTVPRGNSPHIFQYVILIQSVLSIF